MLKTIAVWVLTLLLVAFFLNVSYRKFTANEITAGHFNEWGFGSWLLTTVAGLELTGAILLLFPVTATSGALLLSLIVACASYILLSHHIYNNAVFTISSLILLLWLGYLRWDQSWILWLFKTGGATRIGRG
jgi:uncharacterized membrane protein YphA (DoxX/SURF4 family)